MNKVVYIVNFIVVIIDTIAIAFIIDFPPYVFVMFICLLIEIFLSYKATKKGRFDRENNNNNRN